MKNIIIVTTACIALLFTSCVQKTYKKTVVFSVNTAALKNIKMVGIKGKDKPLSWKKTTEMQVLPNDSTTYTTAITFETGYTFTEVKFVINDTVELEDKDNRRVNFDKGDTTFYKAVYNVVE